MTRTKCVIFYIPATYMYWYRVVCVFETSLQKMWTFTSWFERQFFSHCCKIKKCNVSQRAQSEVRFQYADSGSDTLLNSQKVVCTVNSNTINTENKLFISRKVSMKITRKTMFKSVINQNIMVEIEHKKKL